MFATDIAGWQRWFIAECVSGLKRYTGGVWFESSPRNKHITRARYAERP